jgi:hypothetical protein
VSDALRARVEALLASAAVVARRPPSIERWPFAWPEPDDLAALYALSGGLELADGTVIVGREGLAATTEWLVKSRELDWPEDVIAVGERADLVIARDLDARGQRAGGGVLEVAHDALETFARPSLGLVGYLEARAGLAADADASPEAAARAAALAGDRVALEAALARPFFPGAEGAFAHAALALGRLAAGSGDLDGARAAFDRAVAARAAIAPRAVRGREEAAALRACARAAAEAGARSLERELAERASAVAG